jgi:hypothetical protein
MLLFHRTAPSRIRVSSIQGKGLLVSDAMGLDRVSTAMIGEDVLYHATGRNDYHCISGCAMFRV